MAYRLLTSEEIGLLLSQGCYAANWSDISVKEEFIPKNIRNTRFEGKIKLGIFSGMLEDENGSQKNAAFITAISGIVKLQIILISQRSKI